MRAKHGSNKERLILPPKAKARGNPFTSQPDYEADETEFMMAMDKFKREKRKPFPTWSEVLTVLKGLGWKKEKS